MRFLLFISLLVFGSWAMAQECTTYVPVNVYDSRLGTDVQTLTPGDFQARLNKSDLTIVSASQDINSRLLVLVQTDSLAKDSHIADVVDTVTRLARQTPDGKPLAFGVFADRAIFTPGFSTASKERTSAINAVREEASLLGKRVALYDALLKAVKLFGEHQPGDTVLLIGYPYDDKSSGSASDVIRAYQASDTRLMIMLREGISGVARSDFLVASHDVEKKMFADVTARTGGLYTEFDPSWFNFAWRGYMLGVQLPADSRHDKPRKWSLKLKGSAATLHARLYSPAMLPPCGKAPGGK